MSANPGLLQATKEGLDWPKLFSVHYGVYRVQPTVLLTFFYILRAVAFQRQGSRLVDARQQGVD